jgi:DNA-3-methyladenine glycosylase II
MNQNVTQASHACAHLASCDPALAALIDRIGPCQLPVTPCEPYEALVRAISRQQLHARAADNILGRFIALFPGETFPPPEQVLAADEAALRGCGFSGSKVAAIRDIAARRLDGTVPTHAAAALLDDEALIARLTTIRGVGRWTVEMLLIFTFGRPDVLPVDDFGVREGWRLIQRLDSQPRPRALAALGEPWAPYRSTAAWYLWRAADEGKKIKPAG